MLAIPARVLTSRGLCVCLFLRIDRSRPRDLQVAKTAVPIQIPFAVWVDSREPKLPRIRYTWASSGKYD